MLSSTQIFHGATKQPSHNTSLKKAQSNSDTKKENVDLDSVEDIDYKQKCANFCDGVRALYLDAC